MHSEPEPEPPRNLRNLIRPIRADEYAAEAKLVRAAYAAGPYAHELAGNAAWERSERDTAGRDRDGRVLVARDGERLLGAASLLRGGTEHAKLARAGEAELRLVAVDPAAQGRGLGEALVRAGLEEALRWGVSTLRLDTGVRNPAQRIYERIGFTRTPDMDAALGGTGYGDSVSYEYPLQGSERVRVRIAAESELAEVSALALAAYSQDYVALSARYLAEIADAAGRAAIQDVWVAEEAVPAEATAPAQSSAPAQLLGTVTSPRLGEFTTTIAEPGELDIRLLAVAHVARGRGIGELLVRHGLRLAKIRDCSRLVLETSPEMKPAVRLYERLGFVRLPERDRTVVRDSGEQFSLLTFGLEVR